MRKRFALTFLAAVTCVFGQMAYSADLMKGFDTSKKGDYDNALKEWRPLAEQGDATAQYMLGLTYANGKDAPFNANNNKEAVKWFRLAAEQGHAEAQSILGLWYSSGLMRGIARDVTEGGNYIHKGARRPPRYY